MTVRELMRSVPFEVTRAEDDESGDGLTMEGYAAVFDTPTRINSWEGVFDEQLRKGAFRKTLRERTPVLQFDHGRHPLIGSIPLGVLNEGREDDNGLFVSARLTDNWLIEPIRDAIRDGAVDGMSFRFEVVREEWRDVNGKLIKDDSELIQLLYRPDDRGPLQRTLIEVRVPELGPVVFPAYKETTVDVRSQALAATIRSEDQLVSLVRSSLAGVPEVRRVDEMIERASHVETLDALRNPDVCRDVAHVLLFPSTPDAPPEGHPSETSEPRQDARLPHTPDGDGPEQETEPAEGEDTERSDDAPPEGHPSEENDAPPPGGHPSMSRGRMRAELARLNGRIDAAERHVDTTERRSAHHG